ncbi:MAG: S-methyl-5-thioribose-1-phosphate isomerase [Gammaproteobacteria bacterium]|nr:S-methyl-5-thioribose-1-phosphate isomerase [Gammaproteobacteria bacterium]
MVELSLPETLVWQNNELSLLDQRKLPEEIVYQRVDQLQDAWLAIKNLTVRGAPAIGIAAAYALALSMRAQEQLGKADFMMTLNQNAQYLNSCRPTAVNLSWAMRRMCVAGLRQPTYQALIEEAVCIHNEDLAICQAIGKHGAHLIQSGDSVLTHCNAGSLATSRLGTATAPMYEQHAAGVKFQVVVDETRPLYQGARLTAWELDYAGIDVRLICDNMAATLFAHNQIDLVLVGTDRVTANGDVINKIGTLNLAILCRHFGVDFYVACPSSTFDANTPTGNDVNIEHRPNDEVLGTHAARVRAFNPAFDVTPAALVSGIITEHGVTSAENLSRFLNDLQ